MGESICANISGPAFSFLLYENCRSEFDQEGFLLGEIVTKEKQTITDNDQQVLNIERVIKINSVLPWPKLAHFYNSSGRLNKDKIKSFLGNKVKVVAWYKFKHTASFKLTLREKIILKELCTYFSSDSPEHFVCCLLTTQTGSETGATHLFSQTFIRYNNPIFQTLPMHIVNLKDPYDLYKSPEDGLTTFRSVVAKLRIGTKDIQGYITTTKIEKALDDQIGQVVEDLSEAEKNMYNLEQEIKSLRKKLTILHDCGDDFEDVFGIMENGKDPMEPSSSVPRINKKSISSVNISASHRITRSKLNKTVTASPDQGSNRNKT